MSPQLMVPLDGSSVAAQAIPYAVYLAKAFGGPLTLFSCIPPIADRLGVARDAAREADEKAESLTTAYLNSIAVPLRQRGLLVTTRVHHGNPAATILAAAEVDPRALIVMTTHGRSGFDRMRMGSVTQHVVRHAAVSTLVIRAQEDGEPKEDAHFAEIIVTLDGSDTAEQAIPMTMTLATALHVPVTILRVLPNYAFLAQTSVSGIYYAPSVEEMAAEEEEAARYLDATAAQLRAAKCTVRTDWQRSVTDHADGVIDDYLRDHPDALLVMASHGGGGIMRWMLGSTTEAVFRALPPAMLIVRAGITAPTRPTVSATGQIAGLGR